MPLMTSGYSLGKKVSRTGGAGKVSSSPTIQIVKNNLSKGNVVAKSSPINTTASGTVSTSSPVGSSGSLGYASVKKGERKNGANSSVSQAKKDAEAAVNEAKVKTEASKTSALGYYNGIDKDLSKMGDLITDKEKQQMLNQRKDQLANSSQNLTEAFNDSNSGIQTGRRLGIAQGTANSASTLPIETELDVNQANRAASLDVINQKMNSANAKTNVQMGYNYDAGLDYITSLAEALGESSGSGINSLLSSLSGSSSGSSSGAQSSLSMTTGTNPSEMRAKIQMLKTYLNNNPNSPNRANYLAQIAYLQSILSSNYYY